MRRAEASARAPPPARAVAGVVSRASRAAVHTSLKGPRSQPAQVVHGEGVVTVEHFKVRAALINLARYHPTQSKHTY
jgi:hypothetical protein